MDNHQKMRDFVYTFYKNNEMFVDAALAKKPKVAAMALLKNVASTVTVSLQPSSWVESWKWLTASKEGKAEMLGKWIELGLDGIRQAVEETKAKNHCRGCGSQIGFSDHGDGWTRCDSCGSN